MKLLVSSYACSPFQGSEPGVGWGFVAELAKHHELWVIVEEEKFRADIELYLAEHPGFAKQVHFHFIRKQRNRMLRKIWPPSYYHYYRRWHDDALTLARQLHESVQFDLAHQLTMVGFREPGYLWKLDVPFVWGPVGGMGQFPWRFLPKLGWHSAAYYLGYNIYNALQARFMARPRLAALRAGCALITATPENKAAAEHYWGCPSTVIPEVGLPCESLADIVRRPPGEPLRIVWTGLHIPRKALNLGLGALAGMDAAGPAWELHVLGKGPLTSHWQGQAKALGIAANCHFHGWLPREQALALMSSAHVMLITSLRDLTSTVTIEAMALGLPIVCLDHCGFSHVVDATSGIKVPVTTPAETVEGLRVALAALLHDEPRRQGLASGALRHSEEFSWAKKVDILKRIYAARLAEVQQEKGALR